MKLDELMKMVEDDFTITYQNYDAKVFAVPSIHSKYLNLLLKQRKRLLELDIQLKECYKERYYFYKTKYSFVLETKTEFDFHINSDEKYIEIYREYSRCKMLVDYLVDVVKKAGQLSFDCKNIVTVLQYQQGV